MKLLFASDVHGCLPALQKVIAAFEKHNVDKLVFLGDLLYHGPRNPLPEGYNPKEVAALLNSYKTKLLTVRGNCDAEVDQMMLEFPCLADFTQIYVDNHVFYVTHGHLFNSDKLPPLNKNDIFIHGHFHAAAGSTGMAAAAKAFADDGSAVSRHGTDGCFDAIRVGLPQQGGHFHALDGAQERGNVV